MHNSFVAVGANIDPEKHDTATGDVVPYAMKCISWMYADPKCSRR